MFNILEILTTLRLRAGIDMKLFFLSTGALLSYYNHLNASNNFTFFIFRISQLI